MPPSVSIIVPCYNVAPYVDVCLESLVNQTLLDIEIICVNDGSTDDTLSLLRAWEARDGRLRLIDRENGGLSVARNTGMDVAMGEYIGFVDSDDYVEHAMYARLLEEARKHDAEVTACGYTGFSDHDGSVLEKWSFSAMDGVEKNLQASGFQNNGVWSRSSVMAWNKLYKREFLEKNGLRFEPRFRQGEDDLFWLMILPHASRLAVIQDRLYWYRRQREDSISQAWEEEGCPLSLAVDRLLHATRYWKTCGWLPLGLAHGWANHALRHYLLARLLSLRCPLPQLTDEEWVILLDMCREWFSLVGGADFFVNLGKWDIALCKLLASPPERVGSLCRAWWRLLSHRSGRRGRYYEILTKTSLYFVVDK